MKIRRYLILCVLVVFSMTSVAHAALPIRPGETVAPCGWPAGAIIREAANRSATFDIYWTDGNGNKTLLVAGVPGVLQPNGQYTAERRFGPIPGAQDAKNITHLQNPVNVGGGGGGVGGGVSELGIETLYLMPDNTIYIGNTPLWILQNFGPGVNFRTPDFYADVTGDGVIDSSDVLYAVVDTRELFFSPLFSAVEASSLGSIFTIVGGVSPLLPGYEFFTTPPTFDPVNGFSGTPYTGAAYEFTDHDLSTIPEPGTVLLFVAGLAGFVVMRRRAR